MDGCIVNCLYQDCTVLLVCACLNIYVLNECYCFLSFPHSMRMCYVYVLMWISKRYLQQRLYEYDHSLYVVE